MKLFRRGRHHRTKFSVSVDEIKAGMQPWELEPDKWMVFNSRIIIPDHLGPEAGVVALQLPDGSTTFLALADQPEFGLVP